MEENHRSFLPPLWGRLYFYSLIFGLWSEFIEYDWKKPYQTKELTIRWDFLIKINSFASPQRHTLTVKFSYPPSPKDFFKMILTTDFEEGFGMDNKFGFCIARVDFISHRLADELINVVKEWNSSLTIIPDSSSWFSKLQSLLQK